MLVKFFFSLRKLIFKKQFTSWNGNEAMCELLLNCQANPLITNEEGSTPLHWICNFFLFQNYTLSLKIKTRF